jgi:hypothetical protein
MSKPKRSVEFNPFFLRARVKEKMSFTDMDKEYGVSKQAVSNWFQLGEIPPRAMILLVEKLGLSEIEVREIFL